MRPVRWRSGDDLENDAPDRSGGRYDGEVSDEIAAASKVLLDAADDDGHFAYLARDSASGELQLVFALRGRAAVEMLRAVPPRSRPRLWTRLLRSFASETGAHP
jgi:hypothetical protein